MRGLKRLVLLAILVAAMPLPGQAAGASWEYRVIILQGVTAGGSLERERSGVYVDAKRTASLNELAADGWEVIAVVGAPGTEHAVYLRRPADIT